jgi:rubrerythrin
MEHATIVTKLLGKDAPVIKEQECSNDLKVNLEQTVKLENDASMLYKQFARQAMEERIRIFFAALTQVE